MFGCMSVFKKGEVAVGLIGTSGKGVDELRAEGGGDRAREDGGGDGGGMMLRGFEADGGRGEEEGVDEEDEGERHHEERVGSIPGRGRSVPGCGHLGCLKCGESSTCVPIPSVLTLDSTQVSWVDQTDGSCTLSPLRFLG